MWYVLIVNNIVDHVVKVDPYSIFAPDFAERFITAPEGTETGYSYDGINFTPPIHLEPSLITPTKEELLAQIALLTQQVQQLT